MTPNTPTPENTAEQLLDNEGIFPVLSYAWDGHDEFSSEYVGLAMFFTHPPFKPDDSWSDVIPPMPSSLEEAYFLNSEDFIGVMDISRSILSKAYHCFENIKPALVPDDDETFWLHITNTAIWLTIASDRIRDYFTLSRFKLSRGEYNAKEYSHPFKEEATNLWEVDILAELVPLAESIKQKRWLRNKLVHELATRRGMNAKQTLRCQKEAALPQARNSSEGLSEGDSQANPAATWDDTIQQMLHSKRAEMEQELIALKSWYLDLVKLANLVFMYDHYVRFPVASFTPSVNNSDAL